MMLLRSVVDRVGPLLMILCPSLVARVTCRHSGYPFAHRTFASLSVSQASMWPRHPFTSATPMDAAVAAVDSNTWGTGFVSLQECNAVASAAVRQDNVNTMGAPPGLCQDSVVPSESGALGFGQATAEEEEGPKGEERKDRVDVAISTRLPPQLHGVLLELLQEKSVVEIIGNNTLSVDELPSNGCITIRDVLSVITASMATAHPTTVRNLLFEGVLGFGGSAAIVTLPLFRNAIMKIVVGQASQSFHHALSLSASSTTAPLLHVIVFLWLIPSHWVSYR